MTDIPVDFSICDSHMSEIQAGKDIKNAKWNKDLLMEYVKFFPPVSRQLSENVEEHLVYRPPFRGWEFKEIWEAYDDASHSDHKKAVDFVNHSLTEQKKPGYMVKFCSYMSAMMKKREQAAGKRLKLSQ